MNKILIGLVVLIIVGFGYMTLVPGKKAEEPTDTSSDLPADHNSSVKSNIPKNRHSSSTVSASSSASSNEGGFQRHGDDIFITKAFKNDLLTVHFADVLKDAHIGAAPSGKGMEISRITPGSIFDKVGLQNGDIIEEVNGTPLNSQGGAASAMMFMKATSLKVKVSRGGDIILKTITVN